MSNIRLIGLTGKMGSGKSTLLTVLEDLVKDNTQVRLVKFAQPIYDIQEAAYDIVRRVYQRPENFIKDRKFMQFIGTDWGRGLDKDIWIKYWKDTINYFSENYPYQILVADDLRFDNEAEEIKKLGGLIVKVDSNKANQRIDTSLDTHSSENGVDLKYIDCTIYNNGTVEELKALVKEALLPKLLVKLPLLSNKGE